MRGDPSITNLNRKIEYNRCILPELQDPDEMTEEEKKREDEITKIIEEWKVEKDKKKAEELKLRKQ